MSIGMAGDADLLRWPQDVSGFARIAVRLAEMDAVRIQALCQADAVIDDERDIMIGANALKRIGQASNLMRIDVLHPQLECSDRPPCKRRLELVREIPTDVLRTDQVKLARIDPRRRRKDGQIGFVIVHSGCISEGGSFVQ